MKRDLKNEMNIVNNYLDGINNKELCIKYNRSRSYIQKVLIRHNVKLRKGCEITKKYNINENYFKSIDNGDKAYILGLIYSDGNIYGNVAKINLIKTDSHILYDIANKVYFDTNYQISFLEGKMKLWENGKFYYTKPQALLTFTRKKIVDDLKKYGLVENKSLIIRFPKINKKYVKDFVRGYFDGDGCFYTSKKYVNNNRIQIVSNNKFIFDLKNIIEKYINVKCIICKTNKNNVDRLYIYGNNKVKIFLDWIYYDCDLKLNRKYLHYIKIYNNN